MIQMVRVDYRLLHGQVAFSWTQALGADAIFLVSDTVQNDPVRLEALKLAKPVGTKVVLKNTDQAIEILKSGVTDKYKVFIICETIQNAAKILPCCKTNKLNLGNIAFEDGKIKLSKSIYVNKAEFDTIKNLVSNNYDVSIQMVPSDTGLKASKVLKGV